MTALALTGLLAMVAADRTMAEGLQVHGFAAQSLIKTDRNALFGDSEDGSLDYREAGVNASYQLNSRMLLSGQVLSRRSGELYDGDLQVDYALLNITLAASPTLRSTLHLGRIKNPIGLYNATRDVPFTRPGILLPQSVYFDKTRNTLLSTDGAMLSTEWYGKFGEVSLELGAGRPVTDKNVEWVLLGNDFPGQLEPDYDSVVGALWYRSPGQRLRLGISGLSADSQYKPAGVFDLGAGDLSVAFAVLSAEYDWNRWTLSAEYVHLPLRWRDFGPFFPFDGTDGESYYLQTTFRPHARVELMARYERGMADRDDRNGFAQSANTGGQIPHFDFYDRSWTLGATWHLNRHWMLRTEYSNRTGTYTLSPRENMPGGLSKNWQMFAGQIAFRF
jgi:hypothetical protein